MRGASRCDTLELPTGKAPIPGRGDTHVQAFTCSFCSINVVNSDAKKILLTQLRFFQCLRDGVAPPIEVVDFLCADDEVYSKLVALVKGAGGGKEPTPAQVKKMYNPIFQVFLQAAGDKASKPTVETCVTLTALSTAVVLAGSGDLDTLTILRILRSKIDDTAYGTHMGRPISDFNE